jgi:hypothetical protein
VPQQRAYGDQREWWRTSFLREVHRHEPIVLQELRDQVLPLRRALAWAVDCDPAGVDSAQRALTEGIAPWRARHHLTVADPADDWIEVRTRQTLDEWVRHRPASTQLRRRQEALALAWAGVQAAYETWRASNPSERAEATHTVGAARARWNRLRRMPVWHPTFLRWWSPMLSDGDEGPKREATHFRWLAWWQVCGLGYGTIARHEKAWSTETLRVLVHELDALAGALRAGEGDARQLRWNARSVLLERGEPWVLYFPAQWPEAWEVETERDARAWAARVRGTRATEPNRGSVRNGIQEAAKLIGLARQGGARPGRPSKSEVP